MFALMRAQSPTTSDGSSRRVFTANDIGLLPSTFDRPLAMSAPKPQPQPKPPTPAPPAMSTPKPKPKPKPKPPTHPTLTISTPKPTPKPSAPVQTTALDKNKDKDTNMSKRKGPRFALSILDTPPAASPIPSPSASFQEKYAPLEMTWIRGRRNFQVAFLEWLNSVRSLKPGTKPAALVYGPTGCGKSYITNTLLKHYGFRTYCYGPDSLSPDETLAHAVSKITPVHRLYGPSVVVLDAVDGILGNSSENKKTAQSLGREKCSEMGDLLGLLKKAARSFARPGKTTVPAQKKKRQLLTPPIILIATEKDSSKALRELSTYVHPIHCAAPEAHETHALIRLICAKESIKHEEMDVAILEHMAQGDIRYIMNTLEYFCRWSTTRPASGAKQALGQMHSSRIPLTLGDYCRSNCVDKNIALFDAARKLVYQPKAALTLVAADRIMSQDPRLLQLMVQENYPHAFPYMLSDTKFSMVGLDRLSSVASDLSDADVMGTWPHRNPAADMLCCSIVLHADKKRLESARSSSFLSFPTFLRKQSPIRSSRDAGKQLVDHLTYAGAPVDELDLLRFSARQAIRAFKQLEQGEKLHFLSSLVERGMTATEIERVCTELRDFDFPPRAGDTAIDSATKKKLMDFVSGFRKPKLTHSHAAATKRKVAPRRKKAPEPAKKRSRFVKVKGDT